MISLSLNNRNRSQKSLKFSIKQFLILCLQKSKNVIKNTKTNLKNLIYIKYPKEFTYLNKMKLSFREKYWMVSQMVWEDAF
jgi:hypothetical protein